MIAGRLLLIMLLIITVMWMIGCSEKKLNLTSPTNEPPVASFSVTPQDGTLETDFEFDASTSRDCEESVCQLLVRWDWESDGIWDTPYSLAKNVNHRFTANGAKIITLEVKNAAGLLSSTSGSVLVFRTGSLADSSSALSVQPRWNSTR